jgi:hypothetical protein
MSGAAEHVGTWLASRKRLLQAALGGLAALVAPRAEAAGKQTLLTGVMLETAGPAFAGDTERLTTVSPVGGRRRVRMTFALARRAEVSVDLMRTGQGVASEQPVTSGQVGVTNRRLTLAAGAHTVDWELPASLPPRTYVLSLTAQEVARGLRRPLPSVPRRAVVRVLGVDAGFTKRSAAPGDQASLVVRTDAKSITANVIRCGPEPEPTYANNELKGIAVTLPATMDWSQHRDTSSALKIPVNKDWASGIYAVRLDTDDGRTGFAPLVVRPPEPRQRVAIVVPTTTWHAYNFYDADGDGWGDTWYARWSTKDTDLTRPHANRGVPYRFRSYELMFHHWLAQYGKAVDYYADEDLEHYAGGATALRAAYDLLVFAGHTEYVTTPLYDMVTAFRDRGGNLMFLSANNFFRRVDRRGGSVRLVDEWRTLGRPEAALCGVQYIAGDRGERHAPFTVTGADVAPWAFAGTGLGNGSQFGLYGIEIDARSPESPPGTTVLATIPDLFGPGRSAEMTYYEHASGARVFSAGALNFGGQIMLWPQTKQLLLNVWARLTAPR